MLLEFLKTALTATGIPQGKCACSVKIKIYATAVRRLSHEQYLQEVNVVGIVLSKLPMVLLPKWIDYSYQLIKERSKPKLDIHSVFFKKKLYKC